MITESEKRTIKEISERYAVKRVLLFGSSLASGKRGYCSMADYRLRVEAEYEAIDKTISSLPSSPLTNLSQL